MSSSDEDDIVLFNPLKKQKTSEQESSKETIIENIESTANTNANEKKVTTFQELKLDQWLIETLNDLSIFEPTEIQSGCIPLIRSGCGLSNC